MSATPSRACAAPSRGLSIVELMVGIAVGLVVVAGALSLVARNLGNSRQLLAEARLNQDMRAAVDLVTRDLRRAGYWGHAIQGTIATSTSSVTAQNPYSAVSGVNGTGFSYGFSRDTTENDTLDSAEQFGFRISAGALQMLSSGNWQDITDTKTLSIASGGLVIVPTETSIPLGHLCPKTCSAGTPNCPTTTVRSYAITLTADSVAQPGLSRSLSSTVRVRNDRMTGQCPA